MIPLIHSTETLLQKTPDLLPMARTHTTLARVPTLPFIRLTVLPSEAYQLPPVDDNAVPVFMASAPRHCEELFRFGWFTIKQNLIEQ